jgi:hypothetical protein
MAVFLYQWLVNGRGKRTDVTAVKRRERKGTAVKGGGRSPLWANGSFATMSEARGVNAPPGLEVSFRGAGFLTTGA